MHRQLSAVVQDVPVNAASPPRSLRSSGRAAPRHRVVAGVSALVAIAVLTLFSLWAVTPPAPATDLPAPAVTVVSDNPVGGQRLLTLKVKPQRTARLVYVNVGGSTVDSATVDGRSVPAANLAGGFNVLFHAPAADLPGYTPRPAGIGIRESHISELVLVARTYTI